jgi:uncharacterized membrane protein YjfL (UPF0719 family)
MTPATIGFVIVAVIVLILIARLVHQLMIGESVTKQLIETDNRAVAVALGGYLLGVVNVIIPVLSGEGHSFWRDVISVAAYGSGGIIAMTVTGIIFARYSRWAGLDLREQLKAGNVAAGIIAGAEYLAASYLVSGALTGDGGAVMPTIIFWGAGVVALLVLTHLFRHLTSYDDIAMINQGNVAAGIGYAGLLIALGMMVGFAVSGNFEGYATGFRDFGLMLLIVIVFYPVRQIVVQMLLLGGGFSLRAGRLDREIAEDGNLGAGILEAIGYLATAMIITRIF